MGGEQIMAIDVNQIVKASQTVVDEDGNFTITLWVTSADNPTIPDVIDMTYDITATPPANYIDNVLTNNGYNPL